MDLVALVDRFPSPGQTVTGREFGTFPGGKGANQAVAAGRLNPGGVRMIGKVGDDVFGAQYLEVLKQNNVDSSGVETEPHCSTGIAVIEVDSGGENHIVIVPGANGRVSQSWLESRMDLALRSDIFLLQLEIPLESVAAAVKALRRSGKTVILDPAPARQLPDEIIRNVDFITPNETEAAVLTGLTLENEGDFERAAFSLLQRGARNVVIKAGGKGAYLAHERVFTRVPGFAVKAVDTTAAGDAFNAGLAFALAEGKPALECVRFANAVGALTTTAKGAQTAMPTIAQVRGLIDRG